MKPYVSYSTNSDHFEIRDCYVLYQKHEEHSCLPKMWYEKNWDKSDKKQKIKVREKEIDDEGNLIVVDAITELAEGVEERHKNTIWSKENDTISLKLPYGAKTGADSTIQIPRPTRLRKTVYDDSKFPLESLWKKIIAQNDQYAKELATLTSQLKTLRILLEEKELDIIDAKNNKTKYVCNECKNQSLPITKRKKWDIPIDIDPNCSNCKDEYNKLKKLIIENTKLVYPLLSIKLPVCNTCVTKWGKEAILKCL
tara:strand:- start:15 stop:776 length:762 start_codon:yes stop_codon:yes gene_type:complete